MRKRTERLLQELAEVIAPLTLDERLFISQTKEYKRLSYRVKREVYEMLFSPYYPLIATPEETVL